MAQKRTNSEQPQTSPAQELHPAQLAARRLLNDGGVALLVQHLKGVNAEQALMDDDPANPGLSAGRREMARYRYLAMDALWETLRRYSAGEFGEQELAALDVIYQRAQAEARSDRPN